MAVPTIYARMVEVYRYQMTREDRKAIRESFKTSPMRLMVSGSAALPVHILDSWKEITGHTLLERYGMSEFCMGLTNPLNPSEKRNPGYVGKPFQSIDVVLCNTEKPDEHDVIDITESDEHGVSATGEIRIKTDGMFSRYLNLRQKQKKVLIPKDTLRPATSLLLIPLWIHTKFWEEITSILLSLKDIKSVYWKSNEFYKKIHLF